MRRPGRKRLNMDLPIDIYDELKVMAHKHNITLTMYFLRMIAERLRKERDFDGRDRKKEE